MSEPKKMAAWMYFAANVIILLLSMAREWDNIIEIVFFILGNVAIWFVLVKGYGKNRCSADRIPFLLFMDSAIYMAVRFTDWKPYFSMQMVLDNLRSASLVIVLIFAVVGLILLLVGMKNNNYVVVCFAFVAWWFSMVGCFGYRNIVDGFRNPYLKMMFVLYTLGVITWWYIINVVKRINPKRKKDSVGPALGIFGRTAFIFLFCSGYVSYYLENISTTVAYYMDTILCTRNIVLFMIAVGVVMVVLFRESGVPNECLKTPLMILGAICVLKASMVFFIPAGFAAVYVYLCIMSKDLQKGGRFNSAKSLRSLGDYVQLFMPWIVSSAVVCALLLLSRGLYPLVILGGILAGIIVKNGKRKPENVPGMVVICSAIEAVAATILFKTQLWNFLVIVVVLVGMLVLLWYVNQKHPSVRINQEPLKRIVAGAAVVIMTCMVLRSGTQMSVVMDADQQTMDVTITECSDHAVMSDGTYLWNHDILLSEHVFTGQRSASVSGMTEAELYVPVEGFSLTFMITDSSGTTSTHTRYVPQYFKDFW